MISSLSTIYIYLSIFCVGLSIKGIAFEQPEQIVYVRSKADIV